jgi:hypothetical protein
MSPILRRFVAAYFALLLTCRVLFSCCGSVASPKLWPGLEFFEGTSPRAMFFFFHSSPAATAPHRRRQRPSVQMELVTFTTPFCSSAECSSLAAIPPSRRRERSGHRPGHRDHVRATEATSNDTTSSKVHRREIYFASVPMKQVIFTLFLCSSAEWSAPDAAASRRRKQRSKHRPEHRDQTRN